MLLVECSNFLFQGNCSNVTECGGSSPSFFCAILICDHFVSHSPFEILPEKLTPSSLATEYFSLSVILGGGAGCKLDYHRMVTWILIAIQASPFSVYLPN